MGGLDGVVATLADRDAPEPLIVGVTGPVSVGKTTLAATLADLLLQAGALAQVLCTDAFLLPNAVLEERGVAGRKGFPESFDHEALDDALAGLRAGRTVAVPVYSHAAYDVVAGASAEVRGQGVVIVEGVNALQDPSFAHLDAGIYVDADEPTVRAWYVERFFGFRDAGRADPGSFYGSMAPLDDETLRSLAVATWEAINLPNLTEHIEPTRDRATWVVRKGADHTVVEVTGPAGTP